MANKLDQRIRVQCEEISKMYEGALPRMYTKIAAMQLIVNTNRTKIEELLQQSKLNFSQFEFKKRSYAGNHSDERPYIEKMWNTAFKEDPGVGRRHLQKFGVDDLDREHIYNDIYNRRRKMNPLIGFTLREHFERLRLDAEKIKMAAESKAEERYGTIFLINSRSRR